jgi:hypothetical protein
MEVTIIDLRTSIDREIYELQHGMAIKQRFHKFADAHSEVLPLSDIQQSIAIGINLATKYKNVVAHLQEK